LHSHNDAVPESLACRDPGTDLAGNCSAPNQAAGAVL